MSTTTTNYGLKKIDLSDSPPDITVLNPNFDTIDTKLKEAIDKADSAFQSASNGKTDIAAVVGSPVTSGDTFSSIKTKIQTIKNTMATNLSAKGITAAASETLSSLASKISNILRGQGNAVESQVLSGKTFANADGVLRTGTMPNHIGGDNVAASIMGLSGTKVYLTPPSGHAFNGGATFWDEPNLIAANLLSGKSYFGLAGGIPVLTGIRNAAGVAQWGDGALAVYPEQGYQKGGAGDGEIKVSVAQLQSAEPELQPGNFLNTKNIFGVQGGIPVQSAGHYLTPEMSIGDYSGEGYPSIYLRPECGKYYEPYIDNWVRCRAPNHRAENIRAGVEDLGVIGALIPLNGEKKWASGTSTSSSSTISCWYSSGTASCYPVTISGLSFIPSFIIIVCPKSVAGSNSAAITIYNPSGYYDDTSVTDYNCPIVTVSGLSTAKLFKLDGTQLYTTSGGFRMPFIYASRTVTWYAFE